MMGSASRLTEPPWGIMNRRNCPSTAARATATPTSASACTPQCVGSRLRRSRTSIASPLEERDGLLMLRSLPSLALPSSALRRRHPEGGQVLGVGARKRLLSSSSRSSAGRIQCTSPHLVRAVTISRRPPAVHTHLWRVWIRTFSRAGRLTTEVDKALTTTTSLDTTLVVPSSPEVAVLRGVLEAGRSSDAGGERV